MNPTVGRGLTAWLKKPDEQKWYGVHYNYNGVIDINGVEYHKFQMQPNAGDDILSTIKNWRSSTDGGTHAIMADVYVPRNADKEAVQEALEKANKGIWGV